MVTSAADAQDSNPGFGSIMTSTEVLSRSIVSGSLTFVDTLTVVSVVQNSTCEDSCDAYSEASGTFTNILVTETLLTTNVADDTVSVTTTITLPRSTRTIKVSSISFASDFVTTSVSASAITTAMAQDKCYQPLLPAIEPCDPDEYPYVTTTALTSSPTLVNGTLALTTHSAALPLGAHNPFKPIVAAIKSVFASGFGFDKPTIGRWAELGQGWGEICWKMAQLYCKCLFLDSGTLLLSRAIHLRHAGNLLGSGARLNLAIDLGRSLEKVHC